MSLGDPRPYIGRFAPSPTGPLHAGSLVAALASWLDARAHRGRWLVRIEDVDTPRCVPGADQLILAQLAACGLHPDAPPVYQSQRGPLYQAALDQLVATGHAYPCGCTRADIAQANAALGLSKPRHGDLVYPGTCRQGLQVLGCADLAPLPIGRGNHARVVTHVLRFERRHFQALAAVVGAQRRGHPAFACATAGA